jgi:hypothetical protein
VHDIDHIWVRKDIVYIIIFTGIKLDNIIVMTIMAEAWEYGKGATGIKRHPTAL